jgi:hypothetical protein
MRPGLPCNSVWLVISGPVPRQLGPYSVHVCTLTYVSISNTYLYKQNALRTPVVIIVYQKFRQVAPTSLFITYTLHPLPDGFRSRVANGLSVQRLPPTGYDHRFSFMRVTLAQRYPGGSFTTNSSWMVLGSGTMIHLRVL